MASPAGRINMALESKVGPELTKKYWEALRILCLDEMAKTKSPAKIANVLAAEIKRRENPTTADPSV